MFAILISSPVHLHGCGDMQSDQGILDIAFGSSPRVWRHGTLMDYGCTSNRFISTGVETCLGSEVSFAISAVHLHGCGDMGLQHHILSLPRGSSPRVWRHVVPELDKQP